MDSNSTTIDGKTFGIGVLSVTACILFVGLILVSNQSVEPAYGIGMNDRGGDYVMLTQQISNATEGVAVIDAAAHQMIIYTFDYNNKRLEILTPTIPLDKMPKPAEPELNRRQRGRRG